MSVLPINLPKETTPLVKVGDKVTKGKIIAQILSADDEVIHLSTYNIPAGKFADSLKKHLGDSISSGDVVAVKKRLLRGIKIYSPFSGTLVKIDEENQDLYLKPKDLKEKTDLLSPVDGVVQFCDNTKISIKTDAVVLPAKDILGSSIEGELLVDNSSEIGSKVSGKILVKDAFDKLSTYKSFGLGAIGIITQELEDFDFMDIEKDFGKTIVTIEDDDYKKLNKFNGKRIYIDSVNKLILL